MEIIIDGEQIKSVDEFHRVIEKQLELPFYYGRNLDALWDCLTGSIDLPTTIIWSDSVTSSRSLGDEFNWIVSFFAEAEKEIPGFKIEYR